MKEKSYLIYLLKFIGLCAVILCHVNPPPQVYNLRNFDVTMLVFASGMGFAAGGRDYLESPRLYLSYVWKRIKRLVLPTWLFLLVYFVFFNIVKILGGIKLRLQYLTMPYRSHLSGGLGMYGFSESIC